MSESIIPSKVETIKRRLDKIAEMELSITDIELAYDGLMAIERVLDELTITDKNKRRW